MSDGFERARLYTSHPIPPASRSIRVLHIHAQSDDATEGQAIKCDLSVEDLDAQPKFDALSYVWGPPAAGYYQLSCGSATLSVSRNCYSALWHLRKKLGTFCIWIDAVCIDQENVQEKEQQIGLMGEIYANAYEVYIWLGKGDSATQRAMAYLAEGGLGNYCPVLTDPDMAQPVRSKLWRALWDYYVRRYSYSRSMVPHSLDILGKLEL
jgi:hypothetical protein